MIFGSIKHPEKMGGNKNVLKHDIHILICFCN